MQGQDRSQCIPTTTSRTNTVTSTTTGTSGTGSATNTATTETGDDRHPIELNYHLLGWDWLFLQHCELRSVIYRIRVNSDELQDRH